MLVLLVALYVETRALRTKVILILFVALHFEDLSHPYIIRGIVR